MANDLHAAIMNILCSPPERSSGELRVAYKLGHRDARHAAAELALTAPVATEQAQAVAEALALNPSLHPNSTALVVRFARALSDKLAAAQEKYGYSDGWMRDDWMDECRTKLIDHVAKGDPRDVAAYCAFLWHHGEKTAMPAQKTALDHFADEVESTIAAPGRPVVLSDEKLIAAACATVTTSFDHEHIARFLPRWRAFVRHLAAQGQSGPVDAEKFLDGADVQDEGGLLTYYSTEAVLECVTAALEHVACESVIAASPEAAPAAMEGTTVAWGRCPVCGEDDMRYVRAAKGEPALIHCTNHACRSNGGDYDVTAATPAAPSAEVEKAINKLASAAWAWGESCGIDDIHDMKQVGDSFNEWQRGKTTSAKQDLLSLFAAQPAPVQATNGEEDAYVIDRLGKLLADVAIALKGEELPLHLHSYHDLPDVARVLKLELDLYRATFPNGVPESAIAAPVQQDAPAPSMVGDAKGGA